MAGTQVPTVYLSWLLKELWNYWLRLIVVVMRVVSTAACPRGKLLLDLGGGLFAGMLLGPEAIRRGADTVPDVLFLVWCLRIVEWMRASLWSSC